MTDEEREKLLYCLNEMMEGHFRVMRALNDFRTFIIEKQSFSSNFPLKPL